ncbi:MAG: hydrogenase maturation nickel metallochaperone HypA [Firmicutes bacterium]|nr:hydrogenase maturation nickel metallochaperone HypA [Bacillota bacterium]
MHELGIMKNVLEVVLEHSKANDVKKIQAINLSIGALSDIVPEFAQMFFDLLAKDTVAEGAKIVIEKVPAKIRCRSCGTETEMDTTHLLFSCDKCGSKLIELVSGREFRVKSMEVE